MKLHRQIKALLFLMIISLFTAHNALPHAHHLAASHAEDHKHADHHHAHGHSHENGHHSSTESKESFLFTLLLDTHTHSSHTHVYFTLADAVNKISKSSVAIAPADVFTTELLLRNKEPDRQRASLFQIFYDDDPALNNCPLRAPPVLV